MHRNLDSLEEMDRANEHGSMQVLQVLLYSCFYTKFIGNTGTKYVWVGNKICFRRWCLPNIEAHNWTLLISGRWIGGTREEWRNRFYFCYSQTTCTTLRATHESSLQQWALKNHTLFLLAGVQNTFAAISIEMFSLIGSWRMPAMRISSSI